MSISSDSDWSLSDAFSSPPPPCLCVCVCVRHTQTHTHTHTHTHTTRIDTQPKHRLTCGATLASPHAPQPYFARHHAHRTPSDLRPSFLPPSNPDGRLGQHLHARRHCLGPRLTAEILRCACPAAGSWSGWREREARSGWQPLMQRCVCVYKCVC